MSHQPVQHGYANTHNLQLRLQLQLMEYQKAPPMGLPLRPQSIGIQIPIGGVSHRFAHNPWHHQSDCNKQCCKCNTRQIKDNHDNGIGQRVDKRTQNLGSHESTERLRHNLPKGLDFVVPCARAKIDHFAKQRLAVRCHIKAQNQHNKYIKQ
jgi:hypothetical protein